MAIEIQSLSGLPVFGVKAHVQPGEVFVGGTLNGDKLSLRFKRSAFARQACKGITRYRLVTCERVPYGDGTHAWEPVNELVVNQ